MNSPLEVMISISDPWDLGEVVGWKPLPGELLRTENSDAGGRALIRLGEPLQYRGVAYRYLVTSPRRLGDEVSSVIAGKGMPCSFIGIADPQAESAKPFDTTAWRGGLAFTGDIKPAEPRYWLVAGGRW